LRDVELKYSNLDKQAHALVKSLKAFKDYILHSKTFSYVSNSVIKDILTQPDSEGKRGKWIAKMQEYDLDINPAKLVKEQGLDKFIVESNYKAIDLNSMIENIMEIEQGEDETHEPSSVVSHKFVESDWYKDVIFYLRNLSCSQAWEKDKAWYIKLKVVKYYILGEKLFCKDLVGILLHQKIVPIF
jgi:hypothetical protein